MLVVSDDSTPIAPICAELMRRGAALSRAKTAQDATKLIRSQTYDHIVLHIRPDTIGLLLIVPLLRSDALSQARVSILVDPASAEAVARSAPQADDLISAEMAAAHVAETIGISEMAPAVLPPVLHKPKRHTILALPTPLPHELLPEDVGQVRERGTMPDAVIVTEPSGANLISAWMSAAAAAVVPVIDATGRSLPIADSTLASPSAPGIAAALAAIEPLKDRIRALPETYFKTDDARNMLLARLAVRERICEPVRDAGRSSTIAYRDERVIPGLLPVAESLVRTGHLQRKFFDRLQCCPDCQSSRVLVREECSKCRSGDISEEPVIHHLRCGYQGPERDFRKDDRLVCPKCRNHLEHFSVDYDKPGRLFVCNDCGQTTGDASIGFTCLDCGEHCDTAQMQAKTIHSYALTETGREAAFLAPMQARGRQASSEAAPIRSALEEFVARQKSAGTSYAALFIRLDATGEAKAAAGAKHWNDTQALFASILREIFTEATQIVEAGDSYLVLVPDTPAEKISIALPEIRQELEKTLRYPVGARYDVLAPDVLEKFI